MIKNVLIVEDDILVSEDLREIVTENGYNAIVVSNGTDAFDRLKTEKINFALLDINLRNSIDGIKIAEHIQDKYQIPFVFVTAYTDDDTIESVKRTKPVGFIVKPFDERQIIAAIKIGSHLYKSPKPEEGISVEKIQNHFTELSSREAEVLKCLVDGDSNREIAESLCLSTNTIKVHLRNLFSKINAASRLEAAHLCFKELTE